MKINLFFFFFWILPVICVSMSFYSFVCAMLETLQMNTYPMRKVSMAIEARTYGKFQQERQKLVENPHSFKCNFITEPKSDVDLQNEMNFVKCFSFCFSSHEFKVGLHFIIVSMMMFMKKKETIVTNSTHVHNYMADDVDVVDGVRAILD